MAQPTIITDRPPVEGFTVVHYPSGWAQYRCLTCNVSANPATHVPGSQDCADAAALRDESRAD